MSERKEGKPQSQNVDLHGVVGRVSVSSGIIWQRNETTVKYFDFRGEIMDLLYKLRPPADHRSSTSLA
jgi:hypothetical protein